MADTQFRLEGSDSVSQLLRRVVEQGHYAGERLHTRQGIYVCTPSGDLLASTPPASADSVLAIMQRGLEAWSTLAPEQAVCDVSGAGTWEDFLPVDGLTLDLTVRDLTDDTESAAIESDGIPARSSFVRPRSNLDHVWFSRLEAEQWIPETIEVGQTRSLPAPLLERLVCLHLVDSVSGDLPVRFLPEHVGDSWIRTELAARDGSRIEIRITGRATAHAAGRAMDIRANRIETRLLGDATFDLESRTFQRFEMIAIAQCTEFLTPPGASTLAQKEIGFAFRLAAPESPSVAPHFFHRYGAEWMDSAGLVRSSRK